VIALGTTDDEGIPVIGATDDQMIGWLTHQSVLRAYRGHIARQTPALAERAAAPRDR
jgi:hypothetical protein